MADVELRAFEAVLDTMMDQLSEESTEVIIEPPRYAHAVLVFASGDEPGELLTASRIIMLDSISVPIEATTNDQLFHHYSENKNVTAAVESTSDFDKRTDIDLVAAMETYDDDDIQEALRKLKESRSILDEPIVTSSANAEMSNGSKFDYANDSDAVCSQTLQATRQISVSPFFDRYLCDRYANLKRSAILVRFPSQLRQGSRVSASSARTLL